MGKSRKELGRKGEQSAALFLVEKGMTVLERNLRLDFGEIDILALDKDGTIVIVEVKSKEGSDVADPHESVNAAKQRKLLSLGRAIEAAYPDRPVRIDVISIVGDRFEHFKNAVWIK